MGTRIHGGLAVGALLAAAVVGVLALPGSARAQVFSPARSLSSTAEGYQEPQVSALGALVHVAWVDLATGNGDVYYRRGTDGGAGFGPARNLSEDGVTPEEGAHSVRVLAQGERVYLTWVEGGLRFRASHDRGATFGPVLELTGWPEGGPRLAASGDSVYMAWYRSLEDEVGDIWFVRGVDGGRVFADIEDLDETRRNYGGVELAASGEHVYVLWDDGGSNDGADLFFRRSTDRGITFEPLVRLTDSDAESDQQQLAVQGSTVYVLWAECPYSECQVLLRRSMDAGATFGEPVRVSPVSELIDGPRLVARDSRVFVAWAAPPGDSYEADVYLTLSVDGGTRFAAPLNVSRTPGDSRDVRLVPAGAGVRLAWAEGDDAREVYTRATRGYGLSLGPAENLSRTPRVDSGRPSLASSRCGSQVHVAWLEGDDSGYSVLYRRASLPFSSGYCLLLPEPR
ncbi:MAG TPA: hypothetical protein VE153_07950 [Myxococcus sp.]|nr:hypothetical protein [Myxococcus sp.]